MPKIISAEIRKIVENEILNGKSVRKITEKHGISIGFVSNLRKKLGVFTKKKIMGG